jgi:WD40 repeat protein
LQRELTDAANRWQDVRKAKQAKLASQPDRPVNRQENTKTSEKQNTQAINRNLQKLDYISVGKTLTRAFSEISQWLWWDDPRLPLAKEIHKSSDNWLNALETDFLQESITTKNTRSKALIILSGVVITIIAGAGFAAMVRQKEAEIAIIGDLRQSTEAYLRSSPQLNALIYGLRLGKSLKNLSSSPIPPWPDQMWKSQVITTLRKAVYQVKELNRWQLPEQSKNSVLDMVLNSDGKILVAIKSSDSVSLWDSQSKQLTQLGSNISSVSFSPNGSQLAIGGKDGTVRLWDVKSKSFTKPAYALQDSVTSIKFSPNGKRVGLIVENENHQRIAYPWNLQRQSKALLNLSKEPNVTIEKLHLSLIII